ncbi:DUF1697 domain-containing protein [Paenibacillus contaminans]|uniref:DUF1697 domain-containing protein n=1 Tax=Paenibacillus contaminans TaxID=450362 RepID=A0A329MS94_9BACL|nr:DUF1697 domain-containing protein [Paenibacillus contaminans]RAV22849.1 DUF1697 domain-containing protein [Paenibacillus contaminans]
MNTYIALLRGINVSGQKLIKMAHLKEVFETMPFGRVRTYIQSGNVLFESDDRNTDELCVRIERKLKEVYGFDVSVVIRSVGDLDAIIARNPFLVDMLKDGEKLYVSFLSKEPAAEAMEKLMSYRSEADDFQIIGREVYLLSRQGYGKSLISNNFVEKKLGVIATTRNWETVNKLAVMGKE